VIVRPDGTIEHNRMVTYNEATGLINHDNLKFEVYAGKEGEEGEMKKIYLFGNEKIVRQMNDDFDFGTRLAVGKQFPTAAVNSLTLKMEGSEDAGVYSSKPVINNSYYTGLPTYIPMSECFDIMVNRPAPGTTLTQEEELFITRSLIKFSFCVDVDTRFQNGTVLNGIVLSGLADESFYMPHETNYDPKKYEPSYNPLGGRYITSFETLNPVHRLNYTYPIMPGFDMSAEGETPEQQKVTKSKTVEQYVYFPESKDGTYKVRLLFADNDELTGIAGEQTLEIKDIPRNTHVKVNISFEDRQIKAIVDLLPYTAVDLNPSFGF
ncbi:MAG: hypothetical protein K2M65_07690, partial [Muribaculaceae bacterium]|nr:hypothetical protein [Muribaculaceae bacterium]